MTFYQVAIFWRLSLRLNIVLSHLRLLASAGPMPQAMPLSFSFCSHIHCGIKDTDAREQ